MNGATEKHCAHELIERLPDSQIATAIRFLEFMLLDPVARAVPTAQPDDEPVTEQDRQRPGNGGDGLFKFLRFLQCWIAASGYSKNVRA